MIATSLCRGFSSFSHSRSDRQSSSCRAVLPARRRHTVVANAAGYEHSAARLTSPLSRPPAHPPARPRLPTKHLRRSAITGPGRPLKKQSQWTQSGCRRVPLACVLCPWPFCSHPHRPKEKTGSPSMWFPPTAAGCDQRADRQHAVRPAGGGLVCGTGHSAPARGVPPRGPACACGRGRLAGGGGWTGPGVSDDETPGKHEAPCLSERAP